MFRNYFFLTLKHKLFVFIAGMKLNVPIFRLLMHDMSKFSFKEYFIYNRQFFKGGDPNFKYAWLHHQNHNDHHWEYWIKRTYHDKESETDLVLDMPETAIREMVADWVGASWAYNGKYPKKGEWDWINKNFYKINVSNKTRQRIIELLVSLNLM